MVNYEGIFFEKEIEKQISQLDKNKLPIVNDEIHCTFKAYPTEEELFNEIIGKEIELKIIGYGNDGKNSGLKVEIPNDYKKYYINYEEENPTKLKTPHITLSISEGAKPYKTKDLAFVDIETPMKVKGRFGYWIKEDEKEYLSYEPYIK